MPAKSPKAMLTVADPVTPAKRFRRSTKVTHLTRAERDARGKAAREETPRGAHAGHSPAADRPDPVDLLESQAVTRDADLVPIRYGRMHTSPFAFYRGAALVMASDLSLTPRSGLNAQLCGDAHLSNFGLFASPERHLVFDSNDFDETLPGPWEWDVKRLVASIAVAARHNGFSEADVRNCVQHSAHAYRTSMREFAEQGNLDVWYRNTDAEDILKRVAAAADAKRAAIAKRAVTKARTRDSHQAAGKLVAGAGNWQFVSNPPLIVPLRDKIGDLDPGVVFRQLRTLVRSYRRTLQSDRGHLVEQFELMDVAHKVVGVGSVGTRSWMLLMRGVDDSDVLILQAKQAQASVLESFLPASVYSNAGERVVAGQRLMQASSDIFLGWQRVRGLDGKQRDFYVRQLRDWKFSVDIEALEPSGLSMYAELCGSALARAHARSGDRVAIASYLGKSDRFDTAVTDYAMAYADQNESDYTVFKAAVKSGRLTAEHGV